MIDSSRRFFEVPHPSSRGARRRRRHHRRWRQTFYSSGLGACCQAFCGRCLGLRLDSRRSASSHRSCRLALGRGSFCGLGARWQSLLPSYGRLATHDCRTQSPWSGDMRRRPSLSGCCEDDLAPDRGTTSQVDRSYRHRERSIRRRERVPIVIGWDHATAQRGRGPRRRDE